MICCILNLQQKFTTMIINGASTLKMPLKEKTIISFKQSIQILIHKKVHCGHETAMKPTPEAGQWFQAHFEEGIKNASTTSKIIINI